MAIKGFDYINNINTINWSISKCSTSISKDGNEYILPHVKWTQVKREQPGSKPEYLELGCEESGSHEAANREGRH